MFMTLIAVHNNNSYILIQVQLDVWSMVSV